MSAIRISGGEWQAEIGPASDDVTICFEGSMDSISWFPVNARNARQKTAAVYTNAVQGGPASFYATRQGYDYVRAVQTRGFEEVHIDLRSKYGTFSGPVERSKGNFDPLSGATYIIEEEKSLEDALNY